MRSAPPPLTQPPCHAATPPTPAAVLAALAGLRPGTSCCPGTLARRLGTTSAALRPILAPLAASRHRWEHVLGNHDFALLDGEKTQVDARLGVTARHRYFDRPGFRFVVLDTGAVSTYATLAGSEARKEAVAELARVKARKLPQAQDWNGAVGPKQLAWFEGVAADAAKRGLKVVVFAHHPVAPVGAYDAWDATEILVALGRHRNVVAWFNGHHHAGGFAQVEGLPCVTFHGMVETPDTNAFATARFLADRMILAGHGREPSRELIFRV